MKLTWIAWLTVACLASVRGSKILMAPMDHRSHVKYFSTMGGILQRAGHDVHLLTFPRHQSVADKSRLTPIIFNTKVETIISNPETFSELVMTKGTGPISLFNQVGASFVELCEDMYSDQGFMKRVAAEKYDLVILDGMDFFRCIYILPYRFDIPYITVTPRHDPWSARLSANPSGESLMPLFMYDNPQDPSFLQRFKNLLGYFGLYIAMPPWSIPENLIAKYAPHKPETTYFDLFQASELFMVNGDIFCLDFPRVKASHYMFIGGIGREPVKPLPAELEQFIQDTEAGVVIMTFGSALEKIPMDKLEIMLAAFRQIKQKVIMRYDGPRPDYIPPNVKLLKWLPQNDLLGHPKIKLFITHGGNNGQMEALYHSVPMVTVPVFGDQFYNGQRVKAKGFGEVVDYRQMTTIDLLKAMETVLTDKTYKERISKCSERFQAMPNTSETVRFWVDHVIKFGGNHLKPKYMKMPLWKFFGLDILFILGEILHFSIHGVKFIVVSVIIFILRKIKKACLSTEETKSKKE